MRADVNIHDVLVAARDVLQERGWAINVVCFGTPNPEVVARNNWSLRDVGCDALQDYLPNGWEWTADFNDADDTTEGDIYDLYDRAIAATEPQP